MCFGDDKVADLLENYYRNLFTSTAPIEIEEVVQYTTRVVDDEMNQMLVADFTRIEVEVALKQMAPLKELGSDWMPPIFYQHYWLNIRDEVAEAIISCLNLGKTLTGLNHTFLTLIPKLKCLESIYEFRPIALCNILYKLIWKVLTNRLKIILPQIISESQSTF